MLHAGKERDRRQHQRGRGGLQWEECRVWEIAMQTGDSIGPERLCLCVLPPCYTLDEECFRGCQVRQKGAGRGRRWSLLHPRAAPDEDG